MNGAVDADAIPWSRYIDALKRHALFILALAIAGSLIGARIATRTVKPVYDAQASLWINMTPTSAMQQAGPLRQQQLFLPPNAWIGLIRSFAVIDPVVEKLRLNVTYKQRRDSVLFRNMDWTPSTMFGAYTLKIDKSGKTYVLSTAKGAEVERGTVGDSIGGKIGLKWAPEKALLRPGRTIEFSVVTPRSVSEYLAAVVRPTLPEDGQFLKIGLSGDDPDRTARTVNAWAREAVNASGDLKKSRLLEFMKILGEQVTLAEAQLHQNENALEHFRVSTITLPSGAGPVTGSGLAPGDPMIATFFQQKVALNELRSERQTLEKILADAKGGPIPPQAFLQIPTILGTAPQLRSAIDELSMRQATLRTEQQYLTDANPRIKQLTEAVRVLERGTIPQITLAVLNSLKAREPDLDARVAEGSHELRAIPARTTEGMRLARRVVASENLFNSLKARYEEGLLAEVEIVPDLAVLDTAVTSSFPSSNDSPRMVFLAVMASIGLALAIALIRDRLDPRLRYPEQATHDLGLTIAATVPKFKPNRRGDFQLATLSQAVESFRTLRLALLYDFPGEGPIVIAVSSPSAGDGKSLISSNLALAFASAGSSTLLIDGDVRHGTLHKTFELPVTPGLVDFLEGQAPPDSIVRSTASENLFVLPRGTRRNRAPELLVSESMAGLVRAMRLKFDVVIIDSPPLAAGIDAYALGAAAGSMVIVLRTAVTDRKLAAAKLEVLDRLPVRILGAVLNAVPDGATYRYYAADYSYQDEAAEPISDIATPKGLVLQA
jgi:capsular exopolysaccharide synthesis family protein